MRFQPEQILQSYGLTLLGSALNYVLRLRLHVCAEQA